MMKTKKMALLLLACGFILSTGCARQTNKEEEVKSTESVQTETADSEETADTDKAAAVEDFQGEAPEPKGYPRELTNPELREFTMWINAGNNYGNYGFLLSEYESPQDMNLQELFYTGAGMECERLSAEEQAAYLKAAGQEEIYTDCTRLTTKQIEDFLRQRLGLSYGEMTHPLEWVYLPDYDIYVMEHGDTNYMNFTCVSGRQTGTDMYELDCVPGDDMYTPYLPSSRLTLKRSKAGYQPVSNIYVEGLSYSMDIWRLDDQCFDVELEGWKEVTFTSYGPDVSAYGNKDVVFTLEKDGNVLCRLPSVTEDNYRRGETFSQILAVSFQDYDEDGDKDIIVIAEYVPEGAAEKGETTRETRIYRNDPDEQRFVLDFDRMDRLDANQWNHTIDEVMEHMDDTGLR